MALKPARLQWSDDGSLASLDYDDVYFQRGQALPESKYVFIENNNLPARFRNLGKGESFRICELGFGSGLNFLLTLKTFAETGGAGRLFFTSIEKHPIPKDDLRKIHSFFNLPHAEELIDQYPPMVEGFHHLNIGGARLMLIFGDVADMLPEIKGEFDAWFLDGFTPSKNPDMWEEKLYPHIAARTAGGGTLATFSSAGHVRRGLKAAGFTVKKITGYGIKWNMTVATMAGAKKEYPRRKVAVIGGSIAGAATAYALARRGHSPVIYEKKPDADTIGHPVAVVYPKLTVDPSPMCRYHIHAFLYARMVARHLKVPSWKECGVLHLDLDEDERTRTQKLLQSGEYPEDFCKAGDGGMFQPIAGMIDPRDFRQCLTRDIPVEYGHDIKSLAAEVTVIAAGTAAKNFAGLDWLPLQSVRGQMSLLKPTPHSQDLDHVICHDGFLTPPVKGLHGAGATFQKGSTDDSFHAEDDAENLAKLNQHLPQFGFTADSVAGASWGFRATTPDKLPMAGPLPDYERCREDFATLREGKEVIGAPTPLIPHVYLSTGFGAHGMTGALLAGEIIAAEISGDPCPVPASLLEHLLPERFIFRGLKRKTI
ncbi:MAG: bifunctional tRNA (5-methylaminomethyl-2-thiouridine)(34)-methyltransferase MnmD/FAD-dependent 5-carboxymethylaminomethyl-2-thiouridine(34) oxidoreductase MnmC [Alphaproteobacteria bacterium]